MSDTKDTSKNLQEIAEAATHRWAGERFRAEERSIYRKGYIAGYSDCQSSQFPSTGGSGEGGSIKEGDTFRFNSSDWTFVENATPLTIEQRWEAITLLKFLRDNFISRSYETPHLMIEQFLSTIKQETKP